MASTWDRKKAAHLYRRAGFGATREELDTAVRLGREGAISRLVDYDEISTSDLEDYLSLLGGDLAGFDELGFDRFDVLQRWWFLRMRYTPRPLEEKMTLFWHNHFATSIDKVEKPQLMYAQNQIFRRLAMGRFGDLLLEVSRDPAMLIWLDNATSVKGAPNENFAREVMELFTMGVGHYGQSDVTAAARAFTGWTIEGDYGERFVFNPDIHDGDVKIFLGTPGGYRGEDIIAILAGRPETAAFIGTKLARFFLGADPSPALVQRLVQVYANTSGAIREIVRNILLSDDFDATSEAPDMVKSPAEFVVGINRALGRTSFHGGDAYAIAGLGMPLFRPPNVGGWKGGRTWIHTGAYLGRMQYAWVDAEYPSPWGEYFRFDAPRFFENRRFSSPDEVIDFIADRLSVVAVSEPLRDSLRGYFALAGEPFVWGPQMLTTFGRGSLYLMLSSPEYQIQ